MRSRNLISSFQYAVDGIVFVLQTQRNMKVHFLIGILVIFLAAMLNVTRLELLILVMTVGLVIAVEMLNTAVEEVVNLVTVKIHPLARAAKNVAAGAVLVTAVVAVAVGYLIFFEKIMMFESELLRKSIGSYNLTLIALILIVTMIIIVKVFTGSSNYFKGGMPSGHTAIAFSLATAILFTGNSFTALLGFILALLVAHSRVQSDIHSVLEVIIGGLIGFLVTLLLFQLKA